MLLTLLKALNTNKFDILVGNLAMPPIDIDVLMYEAQENGEIEVDPKKNKVKALKEPDSYYSNPHLLQQIRRIIGYYDGEDANITRNRLKSVILNPMGNYGYSNQDFLCTMYALEQQEDIKKYEISVPKSGKRPFNKFEFYTFLDHQEFGAKAVNDFIEQFDKMGQKKIKQQGRN